MKAVTVIFCFIVTLNLYAQNNEDTVQNKAEVQYRSRMNGIGIGYFSLSHLSPIVYGGLIYNNSQTKYELTKKNILSSGSGLQLGYLTNKNKKAILFFGGDYLSSKQYLLTPNLPKQFTAISIGWEYWLNTEIYIKPDNTNNITYYTLGSMGGLKCGASFNVLSAQLNNELSIPLVGLYSGSEYSSSLPYFLTEANASLLDAFKIGSLNINTQFKYRLNTDILFVNKKQHKKTIRVQYDLNYSSFKFKNNQRTMITHLLSIGFLFNQTNYVHK